MATAATLSAPPAAAANQQAPAMPTVPFTRAAKEHLEPFDDRSTLMTAGTTQVGPIDVPAYGYLRSLILLVNATGGAGGAAVVAAFEDAPWNALQEVALQDVNGGQMVGPISGYDLYLFNKYGGFKKATDPKAYPVFSAPAAGAGASGNFAFLLRVPVEINSRDALGALANENASSVYKIRYTINSSGAIYTTAPATTLPTVRVRCFLEAWSQPPATDLRGAPQATAPPAHGTIGYISKTSPVIAAGSQTVRFPRVGNYIRNIILVIRDNTPTRAAGDGNWPDPAQIFWDTRMLHSFQKDVWKQYMSERGDFTAAIETSDGLDRGVFVYDWMHEFDQAYGQELRDGWLPTVQSTRLELQGSFGGAGSLSILTHDVAPVGQVFV